MLGADTDAAEAGLVGISRARFPAPFESLRHPVEIENGATAGIGIVTVWNSDAVSPHHRAGYVKCLVRAAIYVVE